MRRVLLSSASVGISFVFMKRRSSARGIRGTRLVLFANVEDLTARGLSDGDRVDIESHFEDGEARTVSGFRAVNSRDRKLRAFYFCRQPRTK